MEYVEAVHALITRQNVGWNVIPAVAHVQPIPRWIRKEIQAVILRFLILLAGKIESLSLPKLLPFGLYRLRIVIRPGLYFGGHHPPPQKSVLTAMSKVLNDFFVSLSAP
jgi:hypothetical protein